MIKRASPDQLRKALEIANLYVKAGVGFVPVPVASEEQFKQLAKQSILRLEEFAKIADAAEKGQNNG